MARRLTVEEYLEGVLNGDRVILSRAITLCESNNLQDRALSRELLRQCLPHAGKSIRVGITGVPGVGKSTFIDAFGMELISLGYPVAVLAVDPSSSKTKGSILGDKTRMNRLAHAPQAYIRPSPSSGTLGGVASKTKETMILCEAAGFQWILVETVGVGQSEIAVRHLVDVFLLLMLPNAGDDLQGIKKGIMEMADLLVINKADGESMEMANRAKALYSQALRLFPLSENGIRPQVLTCSALQSRGIGEVVATMKAFQQQSQRNGSWTNQRLQQEVHWFESALEGQMKEMMFDKEGMRTEYAKQKAAVEAGETLPLEAAKAVISFWVSSIS